MSTPAYFFSPPLLFPTHFATPILFYILFFPLPLSCNRRCQDWGLLLAPQLAGQLNGFSLSTVPANMMKTVEDCCLDSPQHTQPTAVSGSGYMADDACICSPFISVESSNKTTAIRNSWRVPKTLGSRFSKVGWDGWLRLCLEECCSVWPSWWCTGRHELCDSDEDEFTCLCFYAAGWSSIREWGL